MPEDRPGPQAAGSTQRVYAAILFAASLLTGLAVYWPVVDYPFVLDDVFHIELNPTVRSLAGLGTVWTTNYWEGFGQGGLYRPLLKTLWTLELTLLGGSRVAMLAVGAAGHAANATLVAWIARCAGAAAPLAAGAAAFFLLHAASSEVLITVVGHGEIFSVLLGLVALAMVFPGGPTAPRRLDVFVLASLGAALVKEQGFVAAAIGLLALALNRGFEARERQRAFLLTGLGLALIGVLRFAVLGSFGPQGGFTVPLGEGGARVLVPFWLAGRYLALAVAPLDLFAHYGWLQREIPVGPGDPFVWLGVLAIAVSLALGLRWLVRGATTPLLLLAASWLPLAPFLGIVPIGSLFGERHLYHALSGMAIALACGLTWAARPADHAEAAAAAPSRRRLAIATALIAAWAAALGVRTALQVPVWATEERLWSTTLARAPQNPFAATSLAIVYEREGRYAEARRAAASALEIDPMFTGAHLLLGRLDLRVASYEAALGHFETAALSPVQRVDALVGAARAQLGLGEVARAAKTLAALERARPNDPQVRSLAAELAAARDAGD